MKRLVLAVILGLSLALGALATDFSIRATGGMNLLLGGDYNAALEGQNDWYNDIPGGIINSEFSKLSTGFDFGAEFVVQFTDTVGLGLGTGYVSAANDSTLAAHFGTAGVSFGYRPSVSVVPLTLSFHYFLPLGSNLRLHFFAGPGLYFASVKLDSTLTVTIGPVEEVGGDEEFRPDGKIAFGAQGGLGVEFGLSRGLALVLDVGGRYLSLSNLRGPATVDGHQGVVPIHVSTTATLYYYETTEAGNTYADLAVDDARPFGSNVRPASISLSGFRFLAGVRIDL
jgi:hypothetical protein